ncbi:HAD family hydrolase [Promicromonospora sukumoe]|uniref:HAD family hydrolase n=1 Tax=Promicromonospora sukumoe TaxID=88382 RepID=UPI0037C9FC06
MTTAAADLAAVPGVLLDFDGPVTPLMPGPKGKQVADDARTAMRRAGVEVPNSVASSTDHLAVLRAAVVLGPAVVRAVEDACVTAEIRCAKSAVPTVGAHDFLRQTFHDDQRVVIVSNNAAEAIDAYLDRWELNAFVVAVIGRSRYRPDLMKPHRFVADAALGLLGIDAADTVLIGDTVTDMQVARSVGACAIGYAKRPERSEALAEAGADAVVLSMSELLHPAR